MNEFNKDLEKNIAKLERLSSSADKATSSIDKLSEAYNKLQELANEPVNFKIKGSPRRGGSSKSGDTKSGDTDKDKSSKKKEDSKFTKASKKIKQGTEFFNVITDFGSSLKSGKLSSTAAAASKGLGLMGGALGTAAIAVGGVTAALAVLSKVTLDANRKTTSYAQSLRAMGVELSEFDKQNLETSKQMRDLGNRFDNVTQAIGEGIYPVLGGLLDLLDLITGGISSAESKDKIAGAQASISTSAQQSGFSLSSSNNLAGNTYKAAQQIVDKTNEQASDVAKKLADAWLNGSDAAKEYGVVVNDQVLTGYMASQGVDIANVEITDAMKQYYRYQLMMEQLSSSNRDAMQDMIKEWTQLGFIIDKTKGKLFSFDEVIQLTAADPTIPEVGGSGLVYPDDSTDDIKPDIPILPPSNTVFPPGFGPGGLNIPVIFNVPPTIDFPNYGELNLPVNVGIRVPNLSLLQALLAMIEEVPSQVNTHVGVSIPNLYMVSTLLNYCYTIASQLWNAIINVQAPNIGLAEQVLSYLEAINNTWKANVNIGVSGLSSLTNAINLLTKLINLMKQAGARGLSVNASASGSTAKNRSYSSRAGKSTSTNVLTSWAPTGKISNEEAYGSGLFGAVKADIDSLLVRTGIKSETATGITTSEYNKAMSNWISNGAGAQAFTAGITAISGGMSLAGSGVASTTGGLALSSKATTAALPAATSTAALPAAGSTLALPAARTGSTTVVSLADWVYGMVGKGAGFADGGIGTKEIHNATLFEGNKKEAVIPLETDAGIRYLSDAMIQAQGMAGQSLGGDIIINLTLSGVNIADNDAQWERVGRKLAEVIEVQRQRRGELNYGSSF